MFSAKITPIVNPPPPINTKLTIKQSTNINDKMSHCGVISLNNNEKDVCLKAPGSISLKTEGNDVYFTKNSISLETNGNSNDECDCCCCCCDF